MTVAKPKTEEPGWEFSSKRIDELLVAVGELRLNVEKALALAAESNVRVQTMAEQVAALVEQGTRVAAVIEEARPLLESPAARFLGRPRARVVGRGPAA